MRQTSDPDRVVPTRRISFEESLRDLPRHFAGEDDLIASHVTAGLSAVFPDGEDFFVRSVRNYRDQIEDPELKRDVPEMDHPSVRTLLRPKSRSSGRLAV